MPTSSIPLTLKDKLRMAAKESNYPDVELTDEYLDSTINVYKQEHFIFETTNGFIVGCLSDQHLVMPGIPVALEICWWVHLDYRHTGEGLDLYHAFERWAKEKGCKYIMQGKPTHKKCRSLQRIYIREV